MKVFLTLIVMISVLITPVDKVWAKSDSLCQPIKEIIKKGVTEKKGVCQMHITRQEPQVMMNGHPVPPNMMELALSANIQPMGKKSEVIGEFALLGEEVNPVIDALRKGGIDISALHNHMVGEYPQIYFIHFEGMGDTKTIAKTVQNAVNQVSYQ